MMRNWSSKLFLAMVFLFLALAHSRAATQTKTVAFNFGANWSRSLLVPFGLDENLKFDPEDFRTCINPEKSCHQDNYREHPEAQLTIYALTKDQLLQTLVHDENWNARPCGDYANNYQQIVTTTLGALAHDNYELKVDGFGAWCVVAQVDSHIQSALFTRSPIGAMLKNTDDALVLWSQDLATGNQIFHGSGKYYSLLGQVNLLGEYSFGDDQLTVVPYLENADIMLVETDRGYALIPLGLYDLGYQNSDDHCRYSRCRAREIYRPSERDYVFTDKPLYQRGQKIYFKAIVRTDDDARYQPRQEAIPVKIFRGYWGENDEDLVWQQNMTPDGYGTIAGEYTIPQDWDFDYYRLVLPGGSRSFNVSEYVKPEYTLTIDAPTTHTVSGDPLGATINGENYSGQPMIGYQIDWCWQSGYEGGYGVPSCNNWQSTILNSQGQAQLTLPGTLERRDNDYYNSARYYLLIRHSDGASEPTYESRNFTIDYTPFSFVWDSQDSKWQIGQPSKISGHIESSRANVSPANRQVKMHVDVHDHVGKEYKLISTADLQTTTDTQGHFSFDFTPKNYGNYHLSFSVYTNDYLYTTSSLYRTISHQAAPTPTPISSQQDDDHSRDLALDLEGTQLTSDDQITANFAVGTELEKRNYFLGFGRQRLDRWAIDNFTSATTTRRYDLDDADYPNTYAEVSLFNRNAYQSTSSEIEMDKRAKKIALQISTDRDVYHPGEQVKVKIQTRNELTGQPMSAQVTLWTIDEALLALESDRRPEISEFFWFERYHWIQTFHSLESLGLYGAERGGGGGGDDLRDIFKDTAYWNPNIVTDDNGIAEIEFTLPDNLTSWILTGVATTAQTEVGEAQTRLQVKKDIVARILAPEKLRVGDHFDLGIIASNFTDQAETFRLTWHADSALQTLSSLPEPFVIQPHSSVTITLPTKAVSENTQVKITAGVENLFHPELSDSLIKTVEILPYGYEQKTSHFALRPTTIPLEIKPDTQAKRSHLEVDIATDILSSLRTAMKDLLVYPHGCVEQITSKLIPILMVRNYELFAANDFEVNLDDLTQQGIKNLAKLQNYNGGWGFWEPKGNSHTFKTTYVVKYLLQANNEQTPVDSAIFTNAAAYLRDQLKQFNQVSDVRRLTPSQISKLTSSLYGLQLIDQALADDNWEPWQLDTSGLKQPSFYHQLLKDTQIQDTDILSWLVESDLLFNDQTAASQHLQQMLASLDVPREYSDENSARYRSDESDLALAVQALVAYSQAYGERPELDTLVTQLLAVRKHAGWLSTFATAQAIEALTKWRQYRPENIILDHYQILLDNQVIGDIDFAKTNKQYQHFSFDLDKLKYKQGQLEIKSVNASSSPVFTTVNLSQWRTSSNDALTNDQLIIHKAYVREGQNANQALKNGDVITIYVGLENKGRKRHYVTFQDYLPANLRPLYANNHNWHGQIFSFTGVSGTFNILPTGMTLVSYKAVVTNTHQQVSVLPTSASAMYEPNFAARTGMTENWQFVSERPSWAYQKHPTDNQVITSVTVDDIDLMSEIESTQTPKTTSTWWLFVATLIMITVITIIIAMRLYPLAIRRLWLRLKIAALTVRQKMNHQQSNKNTPESHHEQESN
ncbi:hypothetical protein IJJ08_02555 [bacterium]|nr:hypothetical protein [bacterium]